jgi:A/G-specific adenine glycosylase
MPANRLLQHYVDNARALPWRSPPGHPPPPPYHVWISEVMLQQTTAAAVAPRFLLFLERWPTVEALAGAELDAVLSEWAGLGYYARARNLHACARAIVARGGFPRTEAEWRTLPGIGAYSAAAIAAIAFGQRAVVVDANVERVVARVHGIADPVSRARPRIRALADALTPDERPGDFAQAMMDLGATVCRPKAPLCGRCPLRSDCIAARSGTPERFPGPKLRTAKPQRFGTAHWVERRGAIWLVRRPASGLLGGMAALPGHAWGEEEAPPPGPELARVRYVFTHFALQLSVVASHATEEEGWWQPLDRLDEAGLPTLYRKAAAAVRERRSVSRSGPLEEARRGP